MADEVIYKRPDEIYRYAYDFTPKLADTDTAIHATNSTITAVDEEDQDASSAIVGTISRSGLILTGNLQGGTNGKDYLVTYKGIGNTSSLQREWLVELRVRSKIVGAS